MKTKTLKEEWDALKQTVYPDGMTEEQHKQIHRAFYAGAAGFHKLLIALADPAISDKETERGTERLEAELLQSVNDIINSIASRD